MYRLIKENVEVEQGLYADLLMDGDSVEVAVSPGLEPTIYLIPFDALVENAKEDYDAGQMRNDSYKVFNTYADYCRWFNKNVN